MRITTFARFQAVLLALATTSLRAANGRESIPLGNWQVPGQSAIHVLADIGGPVFFVPITPCRLADTRVGSGFTGSYGPPAIAASTTRTMSVTGGVCTGFPAFGIAAASINFTVTNTQGPGDIRTFPAGGAVPLVSTLNYLSGQTIANATIVPVGTGGGITIQADVSGTDLVVDVNGYFTGGFINSGEGVSVIGTLDASGLVYAVNGSSSTNPNTAAIRGRITGTQDGPSAVLGESTGTSGVHFAVTGLNSSGAFGAAGVYGRAGGALISYPSFTSAGVFGESQSRTGVLGITEASSGLIAGVEGARIDFLSGGVTARGRLGSGALGVFFEGGLGGTGTKSFYEPHPTDPTKMIRYVSLEGPEAGTYFRGTAKAVGGVATIDVPESFRMVTDEEGLTVQVTPTGRQFTQVTVESSDLDRIVVRASRDVTFHYLVQGVRRAYKDFPVVSDGWPFKPESAHARLPMYLSADERRRLVENGTYNSDGTVNMTTAERVGWALKWREEEAKRASGQQ